MDKLFGYIGNFFGHLKSGGIKSKNPESNKEEMKSGGIQNVNEMEGTFEQEARTIALGSSILIGDIPCKVSHIQYSDGEGDEYTCTFDAYDIFTGKNHIGQFQAKEMCKCPLIYDNMYRIVSISPEGRVRLQTRVGKPRTFIDLPSNLPPPRDLDSQDDIPDTDFVTHYRSKLMDGYVLFLNVKSAMGKEHICGITVQRKYPLVEE